MTVDYAVAAKAKAMFGKRLTAGDYQELIRKGSVSEIASYLKNQTYYNDVLAGVNEHSIHRGYLELIIRQHYFYRFSQLLRFAKGSDEFIRYGIIGLEVQQIMLTVFMFNDEDRSGLIAQLPLALDHHTDFSLEELIHAQNMDQLLAIIEGTPFYDALLEFKGIDNKDLDVSACELAVWNVYTIEIKKLIEKRFKGDIKKQLITMFNTKTELNNIAKIYRLKKYYHKSPEEIKAVVVPVAERIPLKTLYHWIETYEADELVDQLRQSSYKRYIDQSDFVYIEYHLDRIDFSLNKHYIHFSQDPNVIIISYLSILQYEIKNLINIIEGVRYNVAVEKISELLVY